MREIKLFIVFIVLLIAIPSSLFAAKMRIAIMDFKPKSVSAATANMVSELIRTEMINSGEFEVVERAQMDEIMKEQGLQQTGCTDLSCAVEMGKMLSANKILVGTVMKLGERIIINGRIVDVEKGVAEFGEKQDAESENELYDAVSKFARKLSARIQNSDYEEPEEEDDDAGDKSSTDSDSEASVFSVAVNGAYTMVMGEFANSADYGIGGNLILGFPNLLFSGSSLMLNTGYFSFFTGKDWIDSIALIPISLYFGYSIDLASAFSIIPNIGGGYLIFMMSKDDAGGTNFESSTYFDPHASVRIEFSIKPSAMFSIVIAPAYTMFFEQSSTSQLLGGDIGVRLSF